MPIYSSQSWKLGGPTHTWQSSVPGEHSRPGCKWCLLLLSSCGRNQEIASPQSRGLHPNDLVTSPRPCLLVWPHGCVRISACKAWGKTKLQSIVVAVQYLNHAQVFQENKRSVHSCCCPVSKSRPSLSAAWTEARQASPSFTISWCLLKLMTIESMLPSNHLIFCHPLFLLLSIFPSIRVFPN